MSGWDEQEFAGGASTATPPAEHGPEDPGLNPEFGPNFVRFITGRFMHVERLMAGVLDVLSRRPQEGFRLVRSGNTDANGNLTLLLCELAPGQKYALHRVYVEAVGYTWAAPYIDAAVHAYLTLNLNDAAWDGGGLGTGQTPGRLPCVFTAGRLYAVEAQDGERLTLQIVSGPASTMITARCQGVLENVHQRD